MIEILVVTGSRRDTAYADTPEDAVGAARTLVADHIGCSGRSTKPVAYFLDADEKMIAGPLGEVELWAVTL